MPNLLRQLREAIQAFEALGSRPALIGGLALAAHQVVRATQDIDLLLAVEDAETADGLLTQLGYTCIHRSQDAANYRRGSEGLDILYAHRSEARRLLDNATEREFPFGRLRVVSAEGLIAFKLQALVNDPSRGRDIIDIRDLLKANRNTLDLVEVRRFFSLFGKEELLDEFLADGN